ncbi:MAG: SRPBCC family protein [Marmoricola sp.]
MEPLSLEQTVDINAPVETVWALIGDVRRMAEWSPQVDSVRLSDGATELGVGTKFTNLNHDGDQQWVTHAQIVEWEPPLRVAFKIIENWTIWSYECSPDSQRHPRRSAQGRSSGRQPPCTGVRRAEPRRLRKFRRRCDAGCSHDIGSPEGSRRSELVVRVS